MAQESVNPESPAMPSNDQIAQRVQNEFWEGSKQVFENSGAIDFPNFELSVRRRRGGKISSFRLPIELEDGRKPIFQLSLDVLGAIRQEFHDILALAEVDPPLADDLFVDYSAAASIGEKIFRDSFLGADKPRTPKRLETVKEILTDHNEIVQFFEANIDDATTAEGATWLARFMPDETLMKINGLRAGISMYRSLGATGLSRFDLPETGAAVSSEALIEYAVSTTPSYEAIGRAALGSDSKGIKTSAYFVPEWLFVNAFPMDKERVEPLLKV